MPLKLDIIVASTRPGRAGLTVSEWMADEARKHGAFDVELVDLAEVNLPVYDEPKHPRLQQYEHEHTRRWSAIVKAADAFVFVMPEYNYGPPPALVNAFNYVYVEWNHKPAAFMSYGGVSGGLRGVQAAKGIVSTLKVVPIVDAVVVPMIASQLVDGKFQGNDINREAATGMLNEQHRYADAMKVLR